MTIQYKYVPERIKRLGIPLAPINRLLSKSGADRVSSRAVGAMTEILYNFGFDLAKRAIVLAKHANRKTVTSTDFIRALELIK